MKFLYMDEFYCVEWSVSWGAFDSRRKVRLAGRGPRFMK